MSTFSNMIVTVNFNSGLCQIFKLIVSTVEPRLSGPRLSGFLDYPDFFSGPNLVMIIY